ncbi:hypothetical protein BDQ94DRAFT_137161 [Aspergillus welwitschiae]|uniref:Uncharacterized protein n=1 Tax=Aspergillus welwitschiae TaxID=1341132 RepID=A0A3F3QD09_9EURO|nr:hypothetical protein BDQ94DRAFT_137161 [Aspergillus welwitschiae]RDH36939.1 hypothetical protein BDQ94DRAFT_137161 [Aspergillus welwitschiae]
MFHRDFFVSCLKIDNMIRQSSESLVQHKFVSEARPSHFPGQVALSLSRILSIWWSWGS